MTSLRALIFGMKHCLVDLYQVYTNDGPWVQNGPAAGTKIKYTLNFSFPELLGSGD